MSSMRVDLVADGFMFLEGPRWYRDRLFVSDFYTHLVSEFDGAGKRRTVCEVDGQPSGLGFTPEGALMVVSMLDRRLLRLDGTTLTEVARFADLIGGPANDMVVDALGRAYIGNFGIDEAAGIPLGPTCLVRVGTDGRAAVAADGLVFPNGTVITPDGDALFVSETFVSRISEFTIAQDGTLSDRRIWAQFAPQPPYLDIVRATAELPTLPDGLALDAEGLLWMGDAKGHGAARVRRGGEVVDFVDTGELSVYALALGGVDRRTLYMCASPPLLTSDPARTKRSALLSCRVGVPGAGLP